MTPHRSGPVQGAWNDRANPVLPRDGTRAGLLAKV